MEAGKEGLAFDQEALRALVRHSWPGNVRELQNRIKRAVIMADGKRLSARDLELDGSPMAKPGANLKEARESIEREMILQALQKHKGSITAAAAELGISRPTIYYRMERLNIDRPADEAKTPETNTHVA